MSARWWESWHGSMTGVDLAGIREPEPLHGVLDESIVGRLRALSHFALARWDGDGAAMWLRLAHQAEANPALVGEQTLRAVTSAIGDVWVAGDA